MARPGERRGARERDVSGSRVVAGDDLAQQAARPLDLAASHVQVGQVAAVHGAPACVRFLVDRRQVVAFRRRRVAACARDDAERVEHRVDRPIQPTGQLQGLVGVGLGVGEAPGEVGDDAAALQDPGFEKASGRRGAQGDQDRCLLRVGRRELAELHARGADFVSELGAQHRPLPIVGQRQEALFGAGESGGRLVALVEEPGPFEFDPGAVGGGEVSLRCRRVELLASATGDFGVARGAGGASRDNRPPRAVARVFLVGPPGRGPQHRAVRPDRESAEPRPTDRPIAGERRRAKSARWRAAPGP